MAGISQGMSALPNAAPLPEAPPRAYRVPGSTRTRRNHGVFMLGQQVASVYSTRRADRSAGVNMTVGNSAQELGGHMSPTQARQMAHALLAAAAAVDALAEGGAR